ncbi:3-dehydroquinate synthase [Abditibacterium utsteinense]|uniref:3-dehydroquinate synthase n=1 Tax=Abditibacterium utsteinense TaxID=1960156 RepID=A0A2S8SP16_9BACT|nr:3-dehydroquinate synthase [Abditibacterium utsteinense]PQV62542.1 3-dehydroquinate synthase [Abditibacterium utsteinense]
MIVPVSLHERSYPIHIVADALRALPALPAAALPGEIALISNRGVDALYGDELTKNLESLGQKVTRFEMGDGEQWKSLETAARAYDALADAKFSRRGAIWALGGGVTGDLAGYVAATWMRGVAFVQVPTSLLAMVDSSVGGKTGVNHPRAKNLIGAFWQPTAVICDPNCLQTLPLRELRAGVAEVIKYGVISDADFFDYLEAHLDKAFKLDPEVLSRIIARCCEIKAEVVGEDERESDSVGRRAILNYGHSVGHAFEAISSYGKLLHGEAIALGMTIEARLAIALETIEQGEGKELLRAQTRLFERAGLPVKTPEGTDFEALWNAMALDKKNRGASVNFILPTRMGEVKRVENVKKAIVRDAVFGI